MVEKMVVQKVQQLSKFLSDNHGWPLKSKLLSCFIMLEPNDTNFLLMSAFFLASFRLKHRKMIWWRHHDVTMTLQIQISAKRSYMIYFVDIFLLCKFDVIWIIQTEVFYTRFNFQNIGKFKQIAPAEPPYRNRVEPFSIEIFYSTWYIMNPRIFWRLFLLLFKFLITFFADLVTLFLIYF